MLEQTLPNTSWWMAAISNWLLVSSSLLQTLLSYHIAGNFQFLDISKNITSTKIKLIEIKCVIS